MMRNENPIYHAPHGFTQAYIHTKLRKVENDERVLKILILDRTQTKFFDKSLSKGNR